MVNGLDELQYLLVFYEHIKGIDHANTSDMSECARVFAVALLKP